MATLQKFKMLATQCAVTAASSNSPTRSPSTSPIIHLRRRKTLKMLLTRRLPDFLDRRGTDDKDSSEDEKDDGVNRRKLKDLFVSPPVDDDDDGGDEERRWSDDDCDLIRRRGGGGGGARRFRCLTGTLRQRLLRRAWRPVLVTIPE
ncbi:hypothetical protein Tco_0179016 [Tanacetum coccineum]